MLASTCMEKLSGILKVCMHTHTHTSPRSLFLIVKLYYSFAVLASYALQFYVPMDFLEPPLYKKLRLDKLMYWFPRHHGKIRTLVQLSFRTSLVILTGGQTSYTFRCGKHVNCVRSAIGENSMFTQPLRFKRQ